VAIGLWCLLIFKISNPKGCSVHSKSKRTPQKINFIDEYKLFLEKFEVDFNEQYIFKAPE